MNELAEEYEMLDEALADLGDIEGSTTLDIGTGGGCLVSYLIKRKALGRIFAVDLFTGSLGLLREKLSPEEMVKVILIKADLRRLDFLKDCFFDLVTAYNTLSVVEMYTPGGTESVLSEVYRVLKPKGSFVIIEHFPVNMIKPIDEAQKIGVRFWKMHMELNKARSDSSAVEYTPQSLVDTISKFGFEACYREALATTYVEEYSDILPYITEKAKEIHDEKTRERLLRDARRLDKDGKRYGERSIPHFVIYARKSMSSRPSEARIPALAELYDTIHCRDLLGY